MPSVAAREKLRTANAISGMKLPNECSDNPRVTPRVRSGVGQAGLLYLSRRFVTNPRFARLSELRSARLALTPGTRLGPYEITAQIGEGGMGEVYRAIDTNLKRQVALKVLRAARSNDAGRLARFQREAELLAALDHPPARLDR